MSRKGWAETVWPPLCPNTAVCGLLTCLDLAQNDLALLLLCTIVRRFYFIFFFAVLPGDFLRSSSSGLLYSKHVEARERVVLTARLCEPAWRPGCSVDIFTCIGWICGHAQCSQFAPCSTLIMAGWCSVCSTPQSLCGSQLCRDWMFS